MSAAEVVSNLLEHHGIKGMKWGVRRKATVGPQEVIVRDSRKKIKTSGGGGHTAHPSAVSARTTGQIAKKSGVKALSDEQLQSYAKRIRLEQEVKRLHYNERPAAERFVLKALGRAGNQSVDKAANEGSRKVGAILAAKQAAKVAAVAAA
jgi:hypothetical protein